ncbi:MAG: endolytic transglycosylase MltG [Gammaproteobacteria bacterium]|nr:endolytic transglycosylase MltG [Gammaproteobacteria bacterium]
MRRFLSGVIAAGLVAAAMLFAYAWWPRHPAPHTYHLPVGTTMRAFAQDLKRQHVIGAVDPFLVLAHLAGESDALQAGDYRLDNPTNVWDILQQVVWGRVVQYPVTLVPGWTFQQVRQALHCPHLQDNIAGLSDHAIMARIGHPHTSAQGAFFPDTYFYTSSATATSILRRAYRRMHALLAADWRGRAADLPLSSPKQALILASLVERETAKDGERRKIAGVFINRLRLHMPLQTDPTVIFGLGPHYHGVLTASDLAFKSPYNTYLHIGLPPTPIALPGAPALYAAMHPLKTRALYFVATGLGGHVFSKTLQQQDREIIKYELHGHP